MLRKHTEETLVAFEQEIADLFNAGKIRAPIHLEGGSEQSLLTIFDYVQEEDWVLCSWRSHLKCLLKGVPSEEVKQEILAGHSISLNFPKHKILSSAIVGGICPITVGLAMAIKKRSQSNKVVAFVGDMTSQTGIFHECRKYAFNFDLPIWWVFEDNGVSTNTPTEEVWKCPTDPHGRDAYYHYTNQWPHQGTGVFVEF